MMTSAADTPSSLWMSTGMPRPLSDTDTEPSSWIVTTTSSQWPASASSMRVVHDFEHHVVQAGAVVHVADVHAGALADRLQAAQHGDLAGIVIVVGRVRRVSTRSFRSLLDRQRAAARAAVARVTIRSADYSLPCSVAAAETAVNEAADWPRISAGDFAVEHYLFRRHEVCRVPRGTSTAASRVRPRPPGRSVPVNEHLGAARQQPIAAPGAGGGGPAPRPGRPGRPAASSPARRRSPRPAPRMQARAVSFSCPRDRASRPGRLAKSTRQSARCGPTRGIAAWPGRDPAPSSRASASDSSPRRQPGRKSRLAAPSSGSQVCGQCRQHAARSRSR